MKNNKHLSIADLIKKQIGMRVAICITLLFIAFIAITTYDVTNQIKNMIAKIEEKCLLLENYVVSQSLIDNMQAAFVKLDRYNKQNNIHFEWINNENMPDKNFTWIIPFNWKYNYPIREINANLGYFEVTGSFLSDKTLIYEFIERLFFIFIFGFTIFFLLRPLARKVPNKLFIQPINDILRLLEKSNHDLKNVKIPDNTPEEIRQIEQKIIHILIEKQDRARKDTLVEVSAQVAHDIRSPLAALETGIKLLENIPEKERILIRSATNQIRDIANNLLVQYKGNQSSSNLNSIPDSISEDLLENKSAENKSSKSSAQPSLFSRAASALSLSILSTASDSSSKSSKLNKSNTTNTASQSALLKQNQSAELITELLSSVISQKRLQYKDSSTKILTNMDEAAYGIFAYVSNLEFKRVISNIINNCVEALEKSTDGIVQVNVAADDNSIFISIEDNGCGMSEEFIQKIFSGNAGTQKKSGNGLGLKHAIQTVKQEFHGKLTITSRLNEGTSIAITLPNTTPPTWFATHLAIPQNRLVVVLDDDESIHQVWENRLRHQCEDVTFIHFYNPEELINWQRAHTDLSPLFLCDYELIGSKKTGLDVIEEIHIVDNTYLVTSRYEEDAIRTRCEASGVRIIPKSFAPHIPIKMVEIKTKKPLFAEAKFEAKPELTSEFSSELRHKNIQEKILQENNSENQINNQLDHHLHDDEKIMNDDEHPHLIFIDDNESITLAWEMEGMKLGKIVATFNRIRDFEIVMHKFNKDVPIYIDSNLNDKITGQVFAKHLHEQGFTHLYLATGYAASDFGQMPWIKKIVGKTPVFQHVANE